MSKTKRVGLSLIFIGLFMPLATIPFVDRYYPDYGFIGNMRRATLVLYGGKETCNGVENPTMDTMEDLFRFGRFRRGDCKTTGRIAIPYKVIFFLSVLSVFSGAAVFTFLQTKP